MKYLILSILLSLSLFAKSQDTIQSEEPTKGKVILQRDQSLIDERQILEAEDERRKEERAIIMGVVAVLLASGITAIFLMQKRKKKDQ